VSKFDQTAPVNTSTFPVCQYLSDSGLPL